MPEIQQTLPKFLQIANHIRDRILSGELQADDEVPSERQLAVEWNVSRPTATKALEALRVQGLVESRQGSGTYVLDRLRLHRRARERYQKAQDTGRIYPANEYARIVAAELTDAPDHVVQALGLSSAHAARRHRITFADDQPVEVSTSWYAADVAERAPRLLEPSRILQGTLAYVEESTGRRASYARDQACARLATTPELAELSLEEPAPVLVVHHLVFDADDRPLEFAEAVYPPGRWTFEQEYAVRS